MTDQEPARNERPSPTILVVDDEDAIRDLIAQFLHTAGYNVLTSPSGGRALSACRNLTEPIDLALLDFNLRDMDGLHLARVLNELRPHLRCVFMTGSLYATDSFLAEGYVWISKPVAFDRLLEFVKTQLESNFRSAESL